MSCMRNRECTDLLHENSKCDSSTALYCEFEIDDLIGRTKTKSNKIEEKEKKQEREELNDAINGLQLANKIVKLTNCRKMKDHTRISQKISTQKKREKKNESLEKKIHLKHDAWERGEQEKTREIKAAMINSFSHFGLQKGIDLLAEKSDEF